MFTKEEIQEAKDVNLYDFIVDHDELKQHFDIYSKSLKCKSESYDYIVILNNKSIYYNFGVGGGSDDTIGFLMDIFGYSFTDAVNFLLGDDSLAEKAELQFVKGEATHYKKKNKKAEKTEEIRADNPDYYIPDKSEGEPRHLYAFLMGRGISKPTIKWLLDKGLMFEGVRHVGNYKFYNVVFINFAKDHWEERGCIDIEGEEPHKCTSQKQQDKFWYFRYGKRDNVYIFESALDAISYFELTGYEGIYVSLHSCKNADTIINKIQTVGDYNIIIMTDNDYDGNAVRDNYPTFESRKPEYKDWNEALMKKKGLERFVIKRKNQKSCDIPPEEAPF